MFSGTISVSSFGPGFVPISSCTVQDGGSLNCSQITDASCDHSMDLGVVCNEQSTSETTNPPPVSTYTNMPVTSSGPKEASEAPSQTSDGICITGATTIITALGAVTGVLVILLLGTVTALVIMCTVLRKRQGQSNTVAM